jgi:hypothetical protein
MLHDVELLGRCLLESIEPKLGEFGLDWDKVPLPVASGELPRIFMSCFNMGI